MLVILVIYTSVVLKSTKLLNGNFYLLCLKFLSKGEKISREIAPQCFFTIFLPFYFLERRI